MKNNADKAHNTPYPHIVKTEGVCGGEPVIKDTRIAVRHIVGYYYKAGMSAEEILAEWDYLSPAQVFAALAYYHDNKEQIDDLRRENSFENLYCDNRRRSSPPSSGKSTGASFSTLSTIGATPPDFAPFFPPTSAANSPTIP
jgi:uncharacterized protein (DUF433 family)